MKLTASKMSRAALATVDSGKRVPREGWGDVGALVGVLVNALVGFGGVGVAGKSTSSCKSDKGESRDDFELHIVLLLL
jgi:hypothetical protein